MSQPRQSFSQRPALRRRPIFVHMRTRTLALTSALALLTAAAAAQYDLERAAGTFPWGITKDGAVQVLLASGGLNNPQASVADLDGDGEDELYLFDKRGDVHLAFSRTGSGATDWRYRPELTADWPAATAFALLRDFDADGVPDLFTHSRSEGVEGILAYRGFRQNGRVMFEQVEFDGRADNALRYNDRGDERVIYLAISDVPAIQDLDGDGDLDILSFDSAGGVIDHFLNVGVRGGSAANYFRFTRASECYGGMFETNFDGAVNLSAAPGLCADPFAPDDDDDDDRRLAPRSGVHPGSTITPYDSDGDGDLDLLLGDANTGFITELDNTPGTGNVTHFTDVEYAWPDDGVSVDLDFFPAVFPVVLPGETNVTHLVSPTSPNGGASVDVLWRYTTEADGTRPVLQQRDFLTEVAFDHGRGSHFAMADLSGDGVDDILVGNDSYYGPTGSLSAELALYVYDAAADRYVEETPSWLAALNVTLRTTLLSLRPTLADMDADGDADLLLGSDIGYVSYARNTAAAGQAANFPSLTARWMDIDFGSRSAPAVADVTGDGLPDLVVGGSQGQLAFYPNVGTRTSPMFSADPAEASYGQIEVRVPGNPSQTNASPAFTRVDGELALYVATGQGRVLAYRELPTGAGGTALLAQELSLGIGADLDPCFGRDPDGNTVILLGNARGGVSLFRKEGFVDTDETKAVESTTDWLVLPNPTRGAWGVRGLPADARLDVVAADGRVVARDAVPPALPRLRAGVYVIAARDARGRTLGRPRRLVVL